MTSRTQTRTRAPQAPAPPTPRPSPGVTLPIVHTRIEMPRQLPRIAIPRIAKLEWVPRPPMPPASSLPGRVIWVGGLGAVAALGVIDWPVAAAVAAGTWVAEQRAREQRRAASSTRSTEAQPRD